MTTATLNPTDRTLRVKQDIIAICEQFGPLDVKPIDGTDGYYITPAAEVFSTRPCTRNPSERVRKLKPFRGANGYMYVELRIDKGRRVRPIHRLVGETLLPPRLAEQTLVRHLDGDKSNNSVENLRWGTSKDNMADCVRHGRLRRGEGHPSAKLTEDSVRSARRMRATGATYAAIAARFGVSPSTVRAACTGKTWVHVGDNHVTGVSAAALSHNSERKYRRIRRPAAFHELYSR